MFQEPVFPPQHRTKCYCHTKRDNSKTRDSDPHAHGQNESHSFVKVNKPRLRFAGKKSNFVRVKSVPCEDNESNDQVYTNRRIEYETSGRISITTNVDDDLKNNSKTHYRVAEHSRRLEALSAYRLANPDECISNSHNSLRHSNTIATVPAHTCHYRLKLNERNQPVPVLDAKKDGAMMCSVCRKLSPKNVYSSNRPLATGNCVILSKGHLTDNTLNRLGQNSATLLILELPEQRATNGNGNAKKSATNQFGKKNQKKMYRGNLSLKSQANGLWK